MLYPRTAFRLIAGIFLLSTFATADDRPFTVKLIDYPDASSTVPQGINSKGDVVGFYTNSQGTHGFALRGEVFSAFDYPGAVYTDARAINPGGDIVGAYRMPREPAVNFHGYLLTRNGELLNIDYPGHTNTIPQRILPDGSILGCYHDNDMMMSMHGFVYHDGQFAGLATADDQVGSMNNGGIPDLGIVAGLFFDMAITKSRAYTVIGGVFTPFDFPLATATAAWDMNPSGTIVGTYIDNLTKRHGFLWEDGTFTTFDVPGSPLTVIFGINAGGDVVGRAGSHGFFASRTAQHNKP